MPVNNPDRAFFWDETNKVWRPALVGDPGELVWNSTTKCWEPGTIGAEYKWNASTRSWDFGPGGQYVRNTTTKTWEKVRSPGYGGPFYWDESTKSWLKNTDAAQVSDAFARWDFINNQAWWNGAYVGGVSSTPNWTFTRASTGYAQTSGGVLVPFASGELRRTDKGVLIEGARTNLCLQSQTFDNASWSKVNATVTANAVAAPDGTTTADKLIASSVSGQHRLDLTPVSSASAQSFSVFAKAAEYQFVVLRIGTVGGSLIFNLGTGAVTGSEAGVTASIRALANGWYRCIIYVAAPSANDTVRINVQSTAASATTNFTGDDASGVYIWGAQLEQAAFESSYVPTTTASATRAADSLTVTGVSGLDYPLTLYAEFEPSSATGVSQEILQLDDSTSNERSLLRRNSSGPAIAVSVAGGVTQATPTSAANMNVGTTYKLAARFATDSVRLALSAVLATEDTSATNPASPNTIRFGTAVGGGSPAYGYIRRAAIFSRALSDGDLQALTT